MKNEDPRSAPSERSVRKGNTENIVERRRRRNRRIGKMLSMMALLSSALYIAFTLEEHQAWGMRFILAIQPHRNTPLNMLVRSFSAFGFEVFFAAIPFLILFGKRKQQMIGLNLMSLLNFSLLFISVLKTLFVEPRPIWINQNIKESSAGGFEFSFPSGHSFATTVSWTFLTFNFEDKKWFPYFAAGVISLTAFSRVYFGVHYPHDVIVGILLGLIVFIYQDYFVLFALAEEKKEEAAVLAQEESVDSHDHHGSDVAARDSDGGHKRRHSRGKSAEYKGTPVLLPSAGVSNQQANKRRMIIQSVTLGLFCLFVFFGLEKEYKKQQLGLFYSMGTITASLILRGRIVAFDDVAGKKKDNLSFAYRLILRTFVGMIPTLLVIYPVNLIYRQQSEFLEIAMFMVGIFLSWWLLWWSPMVLDYLGLGKRTNRLLMTGGEEKPRKKTK